MKLSPLRTIFLLLLVVGSFLSRLNAQSFSIHVTPLPCYSNNVPNIVMAQINATVAGAISYAWSITSNGCAPSVSPVPMSSGSVINVHYNCCNTYTYCCLAIGPNQSILATSNIFTTSVKCGPSVFFSGNLSVCAGNAATLIASGATSYSWSTGDVGSTLVITPTSNTVIGVSGITPNGCSDYTWGMISVTPSVSAGFSHLILPNGGVSFFNNSVNTSSTSNYQWNFGNGHVSTAVSPTFSYTSNGSYTVSLTASSICGASTATQVVTINNVSTCTAAISYTPGPAGSYTFASSSPGTNSNTVYSWDFGNNITYTATGQAGVHPPPQVYPGGTHTVSLSISSSSPQYCNSSVTTTINVCALQADFTTSITAGNQVAFQNTSTGTVLPTSYTWHHGDGTINHNINTSYIYPSSGIYTVTLVGSYGGNCLSSVSKTISIYKCSIKAYFTHTTTTNGLVKFSNASGLSNGPFSYLWNFGDGVVSSLESPVHTYKTAGKYYVSLKITDDDYPSCYDSLVQSINITGVTCSANAGFMLLPTNTVQYWNITPNAPWNVRDALWDWGDGTFSNTLYTSHVYEVAGKYDICLSVTVTCGTSSTFCLETSQHISDMLAVNVTPPSPGTGLAEIDPESFSCQIYPNPNKGSFRVLYYHPGGSDLRLSISNILGEVVYVSGVLPAGHEALEELVSLDGLSSGVYFLTLHSGSESLTRKIVIEH
jgi:PKD repeat protein